MSAPVLSVIIPTLGVRPELLRAIASTQAQVAVPCVALVVVNGNRFDPRLIARLEADPSVRLIRTPVPGVAHARLLGVSHVETPYFSLLDDDDELLPDCLAPVMEVLEAGADVVATNGLIEIGGNLSVKHDNLMGYGEDHALALLYENWAASGGLYCRTAGVPVALFEGLPNYMELTQLGMRMTMHCRVSRIDCKTFIYHIGAAEQATASPAFVRAEPVVMAQIASEVTRRDIRAKLRRKRSAALHDCAELELGRQNIGRAWRDHVASMIGGGGHRYLSYTRHLVRETVSMWLRGLRPAAVPVATAGPASRGPDL
ncbi:MAG TPA: glycosyltransferase [Pedomonas sp.]|uniref:glycosyltransferase family 2 protein n=1 Tax=Pedomonas sp. TaxID=2976421 RepID=UPI002F408D48